jgi:hypothetical protein
LQQVIQALANKHTEEFLLPAKVVALPVEGFIATGNNNNKS